MKNLTKAFKQKLLRDERDYLVFASITLEDDTVLSLTNSEIWANGFSYEEAVSSDDDFNALGSVIIGSATLIINNIYETYSPYDFTNARVEIELGMYVVNEEAEEDDDEEILEKYTIGIYTVDETSYNGGTIRLSLLDDMEQFDRPYVTSLVYPTTLSQIVNEACTKCNVPLNTPEFPHRTYVVQSPPENSTTFREVLSWAATIAGCFVKCNPFGELEFKWFNSSALENGFANFIDGGTFNPWSTDTSVDGGTFNPWSTGAEVDGGTFYEERSVHHITGLFSQTISMDDVVITGVNVSVKIEAENSTQDVFTAEAGSSGYVINIENNPFITVATAQDVADWLGIQLIGLRFRKLSVAIASDPSIESGDVAIVIDRKQNIYRALVTRMSFSVSNTQTVVCGASTPSRNNATRFSSETKSYVETRKLLRQEISSRELAFQELAGRINNSAGLYTTMVTPQTGGTIYYMHDKPNLSDSKNVWKMTSEVWAVTDDWQGTDAATTQADKWNLGMIVNGDVIARILTATGISADWINTGAFTVRDANDNITFQADADTGSVTIQAAAVLDGMTQQQLFNKLTNNSQNQGLYLSNGTLYLNFTYAQGQTLKLGGNNNANGVLQLYNSSGTLIGQVDKDGLYVAKPNTYKAEIKEGTLKIYSHGTSGWILIGTIDATDDHISDRNLGIHSAYEVEISTNQASFIVKDQVYIDKLSVSDDASFTDSVEFTGYRTRLSSTQNDVGSSTDNHNFNVYGNLYVQGSLTVASTNKHRVVDTDHYNTVAISSYETATPYFGDIGTATVGSNGSVIISIDDIFTEVVNKNIEYVVFLQKEGQGDVWVEEKEYDYFVVNGTPGLKFAWELKAVQSGHNYTRLEEFEMDEPDLLDDVGLSMENDLRELDKEFFFE